MTKRSRILGFGAAALLVIGGVLGAVLAPGRSGPLLALVLISLGLVLATALVFLEIGFSEDRERARRSGQDPARPSDGERSPRSPGRPRAHLPRARDHRRRLK